MKKIEISLFYTLVLLIIVSGCKKDSGDIPTISTLGVDSITCTTAVCGGDVTLKGSSGILMRGVCLSLNDNPTIEDTIFLDDIAVIGLYTYHLTGLNPNTTYYVRAFATNNEGTAYGNTISFTTFQFPVLETYEVKDITHTVAFSGGNITSDGGTKILSRGVCWRAYMIPTITDSKTIDGEGTGVFTSLIAGLVPNTTYYVRAYAITEAGIGYGGAISFTTKEQLDGTISDIDGNIYHTIKIGTQTWLLENLKATRYNNGDPISNITNDYAWQKSKIGAYCDYDNDTNYSKIYGHLYNWYAVSDVRKLAPAGWHIPDNNEWAALVNYLGDIYLAGNKLKEEGTSHWKYPNDGATNESGFTALPGGERYEIYNSSSSSLVFDQIGEIFRAWGSYKDEDNKIFPGSVYLYYQYSDLSIGGADYAWGCSVRCIKD